MAKKQTFGDKVGKAGSSKKKFVKVIKAIRSKESNSLKFNEIMLGVSDDKNPSSVVKEILNK